MDEDRFHVGYVSALKLALSIAERHGMDGAKLKDSLLNVIEIHTKTDTDR